MNKKSSFFNFLTNSIKAKTNSSTISLRMTQVDRKSQFTIFGICCIDLLLYFFFSFSSFLLPKCHRAQRRITSLTRASFHQPCRLALFKRRYPFFPRLLPLLPSASFLPCPLELTSNYVVWMLTLILHKIYQRNVPLCFYPDLPTHPWGLQNSLNVSADSSWLLSQFCWMRLKKSWKSKTFHTLLDCKDNNVSSGLSRQC